MMMGLVIAIRTLVMVFLIGLTGVASVAAISAVTAAIALTGNALIISDTGVSDPADAAGYTENVVEYREAPATAPCASDCSPLVMSYIGQWWPFPVPGWGGL